MTYEFEGKTEKDAIEKAMQELGLERDSFDIEILEAQRGGLFKKGYVKICLHTDDHQAEETLRDKRSVKRVWQETVQEEIPADEEFESKMIEFLNFVLSRIDPGTRVHVEKRERRKVVFSIDTKDSAIIIGKKGKNLDALQLLANLHAAKLRKGEPKVVLDCENYRIHHEESLARLAYSVADKVRSTKQSILLEPMNPYDRRLVHSVIGESDDIETNSEGEGLYKQIRVSCRIQR
ncbi:MAG: protein jag [Spirochaetaceae bacterium]|jgi:spoIIIJ-associated protein|nr:protein jag [Spirochaetaceae bacterium]